MLRQAGGLLHARRASRLTGADAFTARPGRPHDGLSPAPHKITADHTIMRQRRSGRVRRQGLEPRTRGLRALLSYQISALDASLCRSVRASTRIPADWCRVLTGGTGADEQTPSKHQDHQQAALTER